VPPIRTLRYFLPIIEVFAAPLDPGYLQYLQASSVLSSPAAGGEAEPSGVGVNPGGLPCLGLWRAQRAPMMLTYTASHAI